jgi:endonuclease/exonuclease/phosphatase family metal-dependent hydrolase
MAPRSIWFLVLFVVAACGDDGGGGAPDGATPPDAAMVADAPVGVDATTDATADAPADAAIDATGDASVDAPIDAPVNAAVDATIDAPVDATIDASIDARSDASLPDASLPDASLPDASLPDASLPDASLPDASLPDAAPLPTTIRIVAANTTSGSGQSYQDPGIRIFQGLDPDIALVQEMNYGNNSAEALAELVSRAFGPDFHYYREPVSGIPNGIVSRYPIIAAGQWDQPEMTNREFVWARIDVPGPVDLWAVSIHLKAGSEAARRRVEARALADAIRAAVPAGDYLVIGGDLNTSSRTEGCLTELSTVVGTGAPWPHDQAGDGDTNAGRSSPYDWVLFDADLAARAIPVEVGPNVHANGLVFDSRVYTPLTAVAPVLASDSDAPSMQHMAVVRDVALP